MSAIKISVLMFAAAMVLACDNQPLNLGAPSNLPQQASRSATQLPFLGSYTLQSSAVFTPPATLTITGTAEGNATHLGRFTATSVDVINGTTSTGTLTLTAANGDQLFTTTSGQEDEFIPPNISRTTIVATIVGGTGRFAAATGTFTLHNIGVIDFATGTASGTGSLEGHISLNK